MDCIGPLTPDDADLLAYADDAASPAVREHISGCPACQERALELRLEQWKLQKLLHRAACPTPLALGEYHLGLVDELRASELTDHLAYCPACRSELADLGSFMKEIRRPVADAAEDLFGSLRTVVARLSIGPLTGPSGALAPALRGPDDESEGQPTIYDAEDVLVTIDSWTERPGQSGRVVAGLVAGPVDFSSAEASLDRDEISTTSPIDHLGNFLFSDVSPGVHSLTIWLPATGIQIEIDGLTVK
ncbi:MAG: anti-sigma factor family protein [Nitrososphaerales archaeon]